MEAEKQLFKAGTIVRRKTNPRGMVTDVEKIGRKIVYTVLFTDDAEGNEVLAVDARDVEMITSTGGSLKGSIVRFKELERGMVVKYRKDGDGYNVFVRLAYDPKLAWFEEDNLDVEN